jgi:hypothetical protein
MMKDVLSPQPMRTQNRECLFGSIASGEFVVMPNHIHGIVVLFTTDAG